MSQVLDGPDGALRGESASFAQQGIWISERMGRGGSAYHMPLAIWLDGPLDVPALLAACTDVIDRHRVLASVVEERDGALLLAAAATEPPVEYEEVTESLEEFVRHEVIRGFDLERGPLSRFTLAAVAPGRHLLLFVAHHLVFDGVSKDILVRDVAAYYAVRVAGGAPPPPLPTSFAAAAAAEHDRVAAGLPAAQAFWRHRWAEPVEIVLPGQGRTARLAAAGDAIEFVADDELRDGVRAIAQEAAATTFEVLLSALHVVLRRYGNDEVAVAIDMTTRGPDTRDHIGPFVNELPVLTGPAPGRPFRQFVQAVRAELRELYRFRETPLARAVAGVTPRAALTPVSLSYRRRDAEPSFPGLAVRVGWMLFNQGARNALHIQVVDEPGALTLSLQFNPAAVDRVTVAGFAGHLRALLRSAAADPDGALGDLDLLPVDERRRTLVDWNDTGAAFAPETTLLDLFGEQIRARPDALAVTYEGRSLSYAELDAAANRLAHRLRREGVGHGALVAVYLAPSDSMLIGLLAILKAGAAYLPLDPAYPAERLAMIMADAEPRLVLTEPGLPVLPGRTILVDGDFAGEPETDPTPPPAAVETAYVIYTSGSTGRPKGVEVEHRNLANLLLAMRDQLAAGAGDVWLALTSLSFDISALELFLPLVVGGRVVIAPEGAERRPAALASLVAAEGVTHVQATPSGWRLLLPGGVAGPEVTALAGGEPLPGALAAELGGRARELINVYGPTETTIWSTLGRPKGVVTIGRPIANTQVYLLDERMNPVPAGVVGELYIGGFGVARGYRGRPALTAERFVPDPYGPPGARLYRTGDRARYQADGAIEFLGRLDNQVKLRGHRIELGEIEARLADHSHVDQAVVQLHEADDPSLVGYVVAKDAVQVDAAELSAYLARTLPAIMVPSAFVALEALPLTPNGKLDRTALPEPVWTQPAGGAAAPPGGLAAEVRQIWQEVLGFDDIGLEDDLFDLGGHSLTITQITARIRERIGAEISLDVFFDDPTITGVVEAISAVRTEQPEETGPVPRPDGMAPPLSFAQERLWFLQALYPDDAGYNMFYVLRLRGALDHDALGAALDGVVARHESLRTSFGNVDGVPVAVIHPAEPVPVEHLDVIGAGAAAEAEARRLVAERTNAPFDLAAGPPLRVTLLRLAADDHVLCIVLHHIIGDGWSLNILFDDLAWLYEGDSESLAPLPVRYGDVVLWQRQQETGPAGEAAANAALDYWRRQLARPPMLELPADHPDAERDSANGGFHAFRIPEDVIATVEQIAGDDGATLFMALLAAYQAWLARHTGQTDVLVGTPWAVRDRVELEPVIGYLTDTLVLRGDLTGDPTFRELLGRARRTVLDALTHHNVPFERLITELNLPRDTLRSPLLPTMLTLHSEGLPRARMGDLAVEFIDPGAHQAKFDLALEAWRDDDGLFCLLGYDATLFEADTIAALAVRFGLLLEGLAADPDRPVSAVPLLTDTDLAALSQPVMADPPTTVPAMFATTVAAAPDLVAIACGDEQITYAELNARAAGLAAVLRRRGVTAGSVVGVCLDRSIGTMAALLAIWRAGGAYLPLDPDYPDERLAFLIDDSGARVVLTGTGLADRLPASTDTLIVDVVDVGDTEDLPVVGPRDAAYVIYTSGSTGRPKGVVVEHGALADRIRWMRRAYDLGPGDRVVQFASLSFDAHAEEIYPALTAGAAVTLLPDGATSLPDVLRTPAGRTVTVLDLPTAYWQRLTEMLGDVAWPEALRLVILGGEQVHAAAVARWRVRFGDRVRLVNTYGPTEATIVATAVDLGERDAAERPPIGRPLAGTTAYVLDEHGRPVPPGTQGELCLGGAGLARGYLGRAALTAERFVPDPYGPPGARLYRTGDRVRWRRDGVLEFRGRLDDQVKVRGFRVEPGEVEARLRDHPGVGQAAVVATADALTAYVTGPATTEELRRHVAAALPPHLVPTTWVTLDALPLTVAGKVDVAALPAPDPVSAPVFVAPRTDAEELVVSVWAEVLELEQHRIGALDDFFALGGHSLLATRMVALLRATLDVDVPIRTVFDHPSVAALAGAVEELLVEELSGLPEDEAARLVESP